MRKKRKPKSAIQEAMSVGNGPKTITGGGYHTDRRRKRARDKDRRELNPEIW